MAVITYDGICKKLGFRPFVDDYDISVKNYEDDSWESPFRSLSSEELTFLMDYYMNHVKKVA